MLELHNGGSKSQESTHGDTKNWRLQLITIVSNYDIRQCLSPGSTSLASNPDVTRASAKWWQDKGNVFEWGVVGIRRRVGSVPRLHSAKILISQGTSIVELRCKVAFKMIALDYRIHRETRPTYQIGAYELVSGMKEEYD